MPKAGSPLSKKNKDAITFLKKPIDWRNFPRSHHDSFDKDMNQLVPARQYMHQSLQNDDLVIKVKPMIKYENNPKYTRLMNESNLSRYY